MTAYLPPRPDWGHLRREAKSLLKAQRQGDAAPCPILRHLHRFTNASDAEILASEMKLNEAQFALALEYNFSSWNALKHHVEQLRAKSLTFKADTLIKTREIKHYIDKGADFYLRMLADAEHMEIVDNGIYEIMRSRGDVNHLCVVYNIRLEHLSDEEIIEAVKEIRELKVHTWWPARSERVLDIMDGKDRGPEGPFGDAELYGIMVAEEVPKYPKTPNSIKIQRVHSQEEFQVWCDLDNDVEHGGHIHMHTQNHYHLITNGKLRCYLGYVDSIPVTTAAILNNVGTASLEFTATLPEHRQNGFARAVCQYALKDAFKAGVEVVSIRSFGIARILGKSLGFRYDAPSDSIWGIPQNNI